MSDSVKLLEECNKGCNTAVKSMIKILEHVDNEKIREMIDKYTEEHKKLEEKSELLLKQQGKSEKTPGFIVENMISMNTTMKIEWSSEEKKDEKVLEMLREGCEKGIQSLQQKQEEYEQASKESHEIAETIIAVEKDFLEEIDAFYER